MKSVQQPDWFFRLLNGLATVSTVLVFWAINAQERLPELAGAQALTFIDLFVITQSTLIACLIVWVVDQLEPSLSVGKKLGQSLLLFLLLVPLAAWLAYAKGFGIQLDRTPFLYLDLPLALPVFVAWAWTYLLRKRMYRIEAQFEKPAPSTPAVQPVWKTSLLRLLHMGASGSLIRHPQK